MTNGLHRADTENDWVEVSGGVYLQGPFEPAPLFEQEYLANRASAGSFGEAIDLGAKRIWKTKDSELSLVLSMAEI